MQLKLLALALLAAAAFGQVKADPNPCTPYKATDETIANARIVNGRVERCMPDGKSALERAAHLFTVQDLARAANSGYRQGMDRCVEEIENLIDTPPIHIHHFKPHIFPTEMIADGRQTAQMFNNESGERVKIAFAAHFFQL